MHSLKVMVEVTVEVTAVAVRVMAARPQVTVAAAPEIQPAMPAGAPVHLLVTAAAVRRVLLVTVVAAPELLQLQRVMLVVPFQNQSLAAWTRPRPTTTLRPRARQASRAPIRYLPVFSP